MADLSTLKSSLKSWQNQRDTLEKEIKDLKQRKKDVEKIKSALQRAATNNSDDINRKLRTICQNIDDGMEYSSSLDFSGKEDKSTGDGDVSSANGELQKEINDVESKISTKESELDSAKRRISSLRSQISDEERRQRQEKLKSITDGIKNAFN